MADFDAICRMAADNADLADFIVVYIEEAQPAGGGALPSSYVINDHRTIKDRLAAASTLASLVPGLPAKLTVVADSMSNAVNRAYGGTPDRLYIIHVGTVVYQGELGPFGFQLSDVASWLNSYGDTLKM